MGSGSGCSTRATLLNVSNLVGGGSLNHGAAGGTKRVDHVKSVQRELTDVPGDAVVTGVTLTVEVLSRVKLGLASVHVFKCRRLRMNGAGFCSVTGGQSNSSASLA